MKSFSSSFDSIFSLVDEVMDHLNIEKYLFVSNYHTLFLFASNFLKKISKRLALYKNRTEFLKKDAEWLEKSNTFKLVEQAGAKRKSFTNLSVSGKYNRVNEVAHTYSPNTLKGTYNLIKARCLGFTPENDTKIEKKEEIIVKESDAIFIITALNLSVDKYKLLKNYLKNQFNISLCSYYKVFLHLLTI